MLKYSRNTVGPSVHSKQRQQTEESTLDVAPAILPKSFYVNDRADEADNMVKLLVMESNNKDDAQTAILDKDQ